MTLDSREEAENFLWSLCLGGYENYNGSTQHRQIYAIRMVLKRNVDSDMYDTKCRAACRDGSPCFQKVKVYDKRCVHHKDLS